MYRVSMEKEVSLFLNYRSGIKSSPKRHYGTRNTFLNYFPLVPSRMIEILLKQVIKFCGQIAIL